MAWIGVGERGAVAAPVNSLGLKMRAGETRTADRRRTKPGPMADRKRTDTGCAPRKKQPPRRTESRDRRMGGLKERSRLDLTARFANQVC